MSQHFRYYLRVRYGECDAQKVVFNARYAEYLDLGCTEFLKALGFGQAMSFGAWDYQLVKQTIEWKGPARNDQALELTVWAAHLGNTSFTIATEIRIAGEDAVIVTAHTVHVVVDSRSLTKMRLPDELRSALEKGAPGAVTDHAAFLR